jgi:hypothetical protein
MEKKGVHVLCSFVQEQNKSSIQQLRDGDVDIATTFLSPRQEKMRFLHKIPVGTAPFSAVMSRKNPLSKQASLQLSDLEGETLVNLSGEQYRAGWETIDSLLKERGIEPNRKTVLARSDMDIGTVSVDRNIMILVDSPEFRRMISPHDIMLPFDDPAAVFHLYVLYRDDGDDEGKKLAEFAHELARIESRNHPGGTEDMAPSSSSNENANDTVPNGGTESDDSMLRDNAATDEPDM